MGIKNLNRYLLDNCNEDSINKIHLSYLKEKTLVIDTSIYLYKYAAENSLIENMYLLISILKHYNIQPIFIFDGKPPDEKRELLYKRRCMKKAAEIKYNEIKNKEELDNTDLKQLEILKRQFTYINEKDILKVKELMTVYNVKFYDADGEADQLCAYFVKNKLAWACVSDDMDMFVYGCSRVIRGISLLNHTAMLYNTEKILKSLKIKYPDFKTILISSGTDYDNTNKNTLYNIIELFNEYKRQNTQAIDFYDYIVNNTKLVTDVEKFSKIHSLFDLTNYEYKNIYPSLLTQEKQSKYDKPALIDFLQEYDFIFV